jgi:hypothetical protein
MPSKIVKDKFGYYEYEKDSDCSEDEEIDRIIEYYEDETIPEYDPGLYDDEDYEKNELNRAIVSNNIDRIKKAIENNVKGDGRSLFLAIMSKNNDIIDLIMQYDTPVITSILAESIYYIDDPELLDKLIIYLKDKHRLNLKKRGLLNENAVEDHIIKMGKQKFDPFYNPYSKEKEEKKKIILSLLFRNCLVTELEELKNKLIKLEIKTINNKDINSISSQKELCKLIQYQFDIQIDKYDDFNLEIMKPAIKNTKDDDDDENDDENDDDDDDDDDNELN